jgi:hypothetical protein
MNQFSSCRKKMLYSSFYLLPRQIQQVLHYLVFFVTLVVELLELGLALVEDWELLH